MQVNKYILKNGSTLLYIPTNSHSIAVEVLAKVGSINENKDNNGISHLIEHLLFDGSKKFKSNKETTNAIEKFGGIFNAYTSTEKTGFYIKILNKHFDRAIEVLADIIQNPLFREKDILREKEIISSEINMLIDQPSFYQWVLLNKKLYENTSLENSTCGDLKAINKLTRKDILEYYNRFFSSNNLIITVVGKADNVKQTVEKYFCKKNSSKIERNFKEAILIENKQIKEVKKVKSSYLIIGFKAPKIIDKDSYSFEIIQAILGKGMSGRLFDEISNKKGLAYSIGCGYVSGREYGSFVIYANVKKKNLQKVESLILKELQNLDNISEKEFQENKEYIEGNFYLTIEDNGRLAEIISNWEFLKEAKEINNYLKNINKLSIKEVKTVARKYFSKPKVVAIIEGEE